MTNSDDMKKMIIGKCTECFKLTEHRYGERWNYKIGHIIKPMEWICFECASKRPGFMTLTDINNEWKKNAKS